jgi:hypothetical protein
VGSQGLSGYQLRGTVQNYTFLTNVGISNGDGYIATDTSNLWVYYGYAGSAYNPGTGFGQYLGYIDVGIILGPQGYTGSAGFTGSTGYGGSTGYTGSGAIGYGGSIGYTGSAGYWGSLGYTGSGAIGYGGSIGYTGSGGAGFTGSSGYTGSLRWLYSV